MHTTISNMCPILNENNLMYIIHILDYSCVSASSFSLCCLTNKGHTCESVSINSAVF